MNKLAVFLGLGFEGIFLVLGSFYLSEKFQTHFDIQTDMTLAFLFASLIFWFIQIIVILKKLNN